MTEILAFFATCPRGMEPLLEGELQTLDASDIVPVQAGVSFCGPLQAAYRACLWSRVANRVLLPLARFPAPSPDALYAGIQSTRWDEHLAPDGTLAVDFNAAQSKITHTHYGALKAKDAVVDQFRDAYGVRPSVDLDRPDLRINVYLYRDEARVNLDLSGDSLHRRGYRDEGLTAPLKENLAAAILLRARWPEIAQSGGPLLDPMCGSGTLPIEAALIAGDIAPGLLRPYFGFLGWKKHDTAIWNDLLKEAASRRAKGLQSLPAIAACDQDANAVAAARENVARAGIKGHIHVEVRDLARATPPRVAAGAPGLLVVNPPYGERMGDREKLAPLYARLGDVLKSHFPGWRAAVFTGNPPLCSHIQLRPRRSYDLNNGAIKSKLLIFKLAGASKQEQSTETAPRMSGPSDLKTPGAEMLANRLRKNLRHFGRWARRAGISCYCLYDADLPEYGMAVDLYHGEKLWAHIQEYEAPKTVDASLVHQRRREALAAVQDTLDIPQNQIFHKTRSRQKGLDQYEKLAGKGEFHEVREGACRFLVNFTDYLDTGLFLDGRLIRKMIQELAEGRRFLNLFGYTATATVHAAVGGAVATTTVDMSNTYIDWARRNLRLNGIEGKEHSLIQANCLEWLEGRPADRYDLIFLDPPTFSNSKRMQQTFDAQRDHVDLIEKTVRLLQPGGVLLFSTNRHNLKLDLSSLSNLNVKDISGATRSQDFARRKRGHLCWKIELQ